MEAEELTEIKQNAKEILQHYCQDHRLQQLLEEAEGEDPEFCRRECCTDTPMISYAIASYKSYYRTIEDNT